MQNNSIQYAWFRVFVKYKIDDINFLCLISNEHIITKDMIKNNDTINVYYDNEFDNIEIQLNVNERYIKDFTDINIDATVVQILPKDNINEIYFLSPELDVLDINKLKGKQIYIPQYPLNQKLKNSRGIIKKIENEEFIHLASTEHGSSGSPIFLKDSIKIIGIHKQGDIQQTENYADFISPIFNILKNDIKIIKNKINNDNMHKKNKEEIVKNSNENKKENSFLLNIVSEHLGELNDLIKDLYISIICKECGDIFTKKIELGKLVFVNMMIENKILQNCNKCGKNNYGVDIPYSLNMKCKNCGNKYFEEDLPFSMLEMILTLKDNFKACEICGKNDLIFISERKND